MHKAITSIQEGRRKAKVQSKRVVTTLGDHKDHKQHLSQYKILEDRFSMNSSSLWENKDFGSEAQKKTLGKISWKI